MRFSLLSACSVKCLIFKLLSVCQKPVCAVLFETIVGVLTTCHTLDIAVCSCTDGSRNSQSFLL